MAREQQVYRQWEQHEERQAQDPSVGAGNDASGASERGDGCEGVADDDGVSQGCCERRGGSGGQID